ncbi:MAG: tetratricopeptide repeat protein [Phycisphaerales bacterium]
MTVADQYSNLPDLQELWDYNDPAGTELKLRAVLARPEASDDRGYHAELLTQIARAQGLQRQFEEAHRTLDEAEEMIDGDMHRARVRLWLERGRVFNSSGSKDKARPLFITAWELASRKGLDGLAVDAAHMVATVEVGRKTLKWNHRALDLANSSSDPDAQRWTGSLCNNIGWTYHNERDFERALEYFEQALQHRQTQGKPDDIRIARWCIARCLRSLERVEEALAIQRELAQEIAAIENPDGYVYEELAECLHALERSDEAKPYFRRAHELLSKDAWLVESEPQRIEHLAELGNAS